MLAASRVSGGPWRGVGALTEWGLRSRVVPTIYIWGDAVILKILKFVLAYCCLLPVAAGRCSLLLLLLLLLLFLETNARPRSLIRSCEPIC